MIHMTNAASVLKCSCEGDCRNLKRARAGIYIEHIFGQNVLRICSCEALVRHAGKQAGVPNSHGGVDAAELLYSEASHFECIQRFHSDKIKGFDECGGS